MLLGGVRGDTRGQRGGVGSQLGVRGGLGKGEVDGLDGLERQFSSQRLAGVVIRNAVGAIMSRGPRCAASFTTRAVVHMARAVCEKAKPCESEIWARAPAQR